MLRLAAADNAEKVLVPFRRSFGRRLEEGKLSQCQQDMRIGWRTQMPLAEWKSVQRRWWSAQLDMAQSAWGLLQNACKEDARVQRMSKLKEMLQRAAHAIGANNNDQACVPWPLPERIRVENRHLRESMRIPIEN